MGRKSINESDLIQEICRLEEELDTVPSTKEMDELGEYSVPPYYRAFGSWNNALKEAGCEPIQTSERRSKEELVAELKRVSEECGGKPSQNDLTEYGGPDPETYRNEFGSWNAALEAAGFTPRANGQYIPTEDLCTALRELADELDRQTEMKAMNKSGPYSARTCVNRFGSWEEAIDATGIGSTS